MKFPSLLLVDALMSMTDAPRFRRRDGPASGAVPPVARKVEKVVTLHGEERSDPYAWLRDKPNPEVAAYLEAENAYTAAVMKPTEPFQDALYSELLSHVKETDLSVPYREGDWLYYFRTEKGKQYRIYCRKKFPDGPEQVTLDLNELAKGQKFMALGRYAVSDDGNLLAYSTDNTGFRQYTLFVKDLRANALWPERIEKTTSAVWAADNMTLFYAVEDAAKRPYRVYRHRLLEPQSADVLVYEEKDERFGVRIGRTRSRAWLVLSAGSHTTSEARVLKADTPAGAFTVVAPREQEHEYDVDHRGGLFYIRTNSGGRNFRLVTAPVESPGRANWKEIVPHRADVMLEDIDLFANHLVLHERANGLPRLTITNLTTNASHAMAFPEPVYAVFSETNRVFETNVFRYGYQSLVTPSSVFDYDMDAKTAKLLKEQEVPGYDRAPLRFRPPLGDRVGRDEDPDLDRVAREDGGREDAHAQGRAVPDCCSAATARTESSIPDTFNANRLAAPRPRRRRRVRPHPRRRRDGQEVARRRQDAQEEEHVHGLRRVRGVPRRREDRGEGPPRHLGRERGRPPHGRGHEHAPRPLPRRRRPRSVRGRPEHDERSDAAAHGGRVRGVGQPGEEGRVRRIKSYSPYDNLRKGAYPAMLVMTSFNDSQVFYHEPAKYVARLRTLKTDANPLLLKTNMAAGHGGASGRYDTLHETAFEWAFVLGQLGLAK